jgi:hypothetical protein
MSISTQVIEAPVFERPRDRDDELRGRREVRFLDLPERRFVMIDGEGPPGEVTFAPRMPGLYATAYTLRFALKARGVVERVGPLEGLWWTTDGETGLDAILDPERADWRWVLMIGLPDAATEADLESALAAGRKKMDPALAPNLRVEPFAEGRAAQVLHVGPYSMERPTIERMHAAVADAGLRLRGRHHEIYLGDPRRAAPERCKTLIRHAVE